ncbi:MAG: hypothetical protein IJ841_09290 [Prevotella sp.]|nr:hypothetical protein [Prevotella sp.]
MKKLFFTTALLGLALAAGAQRIDINNSQNRTEDGFEGWVIGTATQASTTADGITITATIDGTQQGRTLKGEWWKDGVNKYSKLVSDGVGVYGLDASGNTPQLQTGEVGITLTISGLSTGEHSLMAYHNNPSGYNGPKLDVYVGGTLKVQGVEQSNRAQTTTLSGQSYVKFQAQEGQPVVVTYRTTPDPSFDYTQGYNTTSLFINALIFDRPNPLTTASDPTPENTDEHAEVADDNAVTLSWTAAEVARKHHVFVGTAPDALSEVAVTTDASYRLAQANPMNTYYWRIDEEDAAGQTYEGDVWTFRPRRLAFPEAEGYGRFAIGGRGGTVYHVTSLDDDIQNPQPGTFRYGITQVHGPRTIVFDVAGVITLKGRLTCSDKYVTIAGQTAPGRGIMFRGAPFGMQSDGITRFIRMRLGYHNGNVDKGLDGLGMAGNDHAIMDHCSISWTIDEGFSSRNAKNITLQRTLISEALNIADHPNYESGKAHGFAATIGGGELGGLGSSFHHNLLAHNEGRNWSISGGLDGAGAYDGHHDMFNNVCYNWGGRATDGGTHEGQFVANYYKVGPSTTQMALLNAQLEGTGSGTQAYYVSGNIRENLNGSKTQDALNDTYKYTLSGGQKLDWTVFQSEPFFPSYATIETAEQAFQSVLSDVGCNQPELDNHDERMIQETLHGTTSTVGCKSKKKGLIDRETDAEGFEGLNIVDATRPDNWDTDQDGMPDWWEQTMGTNASAADHNDGATELNGYMTNLEQYLDFLAHPHFVAKPNEQIVVDLRPYFAGYTNFEVIDDGERASDGFIYAYEGTTLTARATWAFQQPRVVNVTVRDRQSGNTITRCFYFCLTEAPLPAGIATPTASQPHATGSSALYNLKGQRLSAPNKKGLTIGQGRKFIQK